MTWHLLGGLYLVAGLVTTAIAARIIARAVGKSDTYGPPMALRERVACTVAWPLVALLGLMDCVARVASGTGRKDDNG